MKQQPSVIRNDAIPSAAYTRIVDGHTVVIDPSQDVAFVYAATGTPYAVSLSSAAVALARPMLDPLA